MDVAVAKQKAAGRATDEAEFKGQPHTVEMFPSVRGSVLLVGYDGAGEVMVEFRVPQRRYSARMADRLARWIRENDDTPPSLAVIR